MLRVEADRLAKVGDGAFIIALVGPGEPKVEILIGVLRIEKIAWL